MSKLAQNKPDFVIWEWNSKKILLYVLLLGYYMQLSIELKRFYPD